MRVPNACYVVVRGDGRVHRESRVWHDGPFHYVRSKTICQVETSDLNRVGRYRELATALATIETRAGPGVAAGTCRHCLPWRDDAR